MRLIGKTIKERTVITLVAQSLKGSQIPAPESAAHSTCPAWDGWSIVAARMATVAKVLAAAAAAVFGFGFGSALPSLFGFGGGAFEWLQAHLAPCTQPDGIWWKIHGILALSSALNGFPCPFDFPFGGDFASAAALALVGAAEAALAGTAGTAGFSAFGTFADLFGLLKGCSMDFALASSLSSTRNSSNLDHKKSKSQWWVICWPFDLINHSLKAFDCSQLVKQELTKHSLIRPLIMRNAVENLHDLCRKIL